MRFKVKWTAPGTCVNNAAWANTGGGSAQAGTCTATDTWGYTSPGGNYKQRQGFSVGWTDFNLNTRRVGPAAAGTDCCTNWWYGANYQANSSNTGGISVAFDIGDLCASSSTTARDLFLIGLTRSANPIGYTGTQAQANTSLYQLVYGTSGWQDYDDSTASYLTASNTRTQLLNSNGMWISIFYFSDGGTGVDHWHIYFNDILQAWYTTPADMDAVSSLNFGGNSANFLKPFITGQGSDGQIQMSDLTIFDDCGSCMENSCLTRAGEANFGLATCTEATVSTVNCACIDGWATNAASVLPGGLAAGTGQAPATASNGLSVATAWSTCTGILITVNVLC